MGPVSKGSAHLMDFSWPNQSSIILLNCLHIQEQALPQHPLSYAYSLNYSLNPGFWGFF